jgi:hypothetical protein
MRGNWLCKRGFLPHKNFVFAGTPYSPLFNSPYPEVVIKEVLEGRSPSKEITIPLPLIKGKGDKGGWGY